MDKAGTIAVVIPTSGSRPAELARALRSIESQTLRPQQVYVVVCSDNDSVCSGLRPKSSRVDLRKSTTTWLVTEHMNANAARMRGIRAASTDWVALLDDDDEWLPNHLSTLMTVQAQLPTLNVLSSVVQVSKSKGRQRYAPTELFAGGSVAEYLFGTVPVRYGKRMLHTSTLIFRRDLAMRIPWDEDLTRHQDWDWLLSVDAAAGQLLLHQSKEVTCLVHWQAQVKSISRTPDWRSSSSWVRSTHLAGRLDGNQAANILLGVTSDLALLDKNTPAALFMARDAWVLGQRSARSYVAWLMRIAGRRLRQALMRPGSTLGVN